jgi:pyridoxine kinase
LRWPLGGVIPGPLQAEPGIQITSERVAGFRVRRCATPRLDGVFRVNILSIQSHVAYGHVGNSAAVFALQRLGCEVWPVHTVQFSNHTGYGSWKGEVFSVPMIEEVVAGIADRGVLASCDGVLSGYVGSLATGTAILGVVEKARTANPDVVYGCDPVIGNRVRGTFVEPGIAEFFRDCAVPAAQIVTPNHFELDRLVGRDTANLAQLLSAIDDLHAAGPRTILITSVQVSETPVGHVDVIASDGAAKYLVRTPRLATAGNGAGDLIAALFLFHDLRSGSVAEALARATSSVFGILRRTAAAGATELALIAAQDELVNPSEMFVPQRIAA